MKRTKNIQKKPLPSSQGKYQKMRAVIIEVVGAHRSIYKLHCKEMVDKGGQDLPKKLDQVAGAVIQGV